MAGWHDKMDIFQRSDSPTETMSSAPHLIDNEYDLVFAGGGTAACITASRLAADFPDLRILVLECGPTTEDKLAHIQPGQYLTHLAPHSKTMQFFESLPSQHVAGRRVVVPSARCIGGGSSTNFMLYNRPSASDFDDWEVEFGNAGWAARDMIPLLEKVGSCASHPRAAVERYNRQRHMRLILPSQPMARMDRSRFPLVGRLWILVWSSSSLVPSLKRIVHLATKVMGLTSPLSIRSS